MNGSLFEANWYEMPIQYQKYFIIIIQNMRQSLFYHGSSLAILNLETFITVTNVLPILSNMINFKFFFSYWWWNWFKHTTCCSKLYPGNEWGNKRIILSFGQCGLGWIRKHNFLNYFNFIDTVYSVFRFVRIICSAAIC